MSSIHQTIRLSVPPVKVHQALMNSEVHSAFTGAPAVIGANAGDAWSAYGGGITGRQIEVSPTRIVQAWRPGNWPDGVYSLVRFDLAADGDGTQLTLTHTGYPEDAGVHLEAGWEERYWAPMRAFFAA